MARPKGTKYIETPEILNKDLEFELPYKKTKEGFYKILPEKKHIGGKNQLRNIQSKKVKIGYVYLIRIQNTSKYKIGVSENPKRRLSDISSVIPFELDILAINQINNPYSFEESLINNYKKYLIRNEWFELSINQAKEIMIKLHNQQVKESIYG
jgi:hypothetical protein